MTLLILSDSHGKAENISEAFSKNRGVDYVIFLGDGLRDLERAELGSVPTISVRGNCDIFSSFSQELPPTELIFNLGEYTLMMTHGHTLRVKESLEYAVAHAAQRSVDILLFGHTHERLETYIPAGGRVGDTLLQTPMWIFNPGSIGSPRSGAPSFGLLGIRGRNVLLSHGEL